MQTMVEAIRASAIFSKIFREIRSIRDNDGRQNRFEKNSLFTDQTGAKQDSTKDFSQKIKNIVRYTPI